MFHLRLRGRRKILSSGHKSRPLKKRSVKKRLRIPPGVMVISLQESGVTFFTDLLHRTRHFLIFKQILVREPPFLCRARGGKKIK